MRKLLTDLAIQNLKPGIYWDEATPNFGVRVVKHKYYLIALVLLCIGVFVSLKVYAATLAEVTKGMTPVSKAICVINDEPYRCIKTIRDGKEYVVIYNKQGMPGVIYELNPDPNKPDHVIWREPQEDT